MYTAAAFMIAFALWFGGWGVLAAYIGCFIGTGMLMGLPVEVNLYWSLADLLAGIDTSLWSHSKHLMLMLVLRQRETS